MHVEFEHFLEWTGKEKWIKKIEKYKSQALSEKNRFYTNYLQMRNPFLVPLIEYFELEKAGKSIWKNMNKNLLSLSTTLRPINQMLNELNEVARKKILGAVLGDFPMPFLFEVNIASHFLVRGYEVKFVDLENGGGEKSYDFLVSKDGVSAEVECKRIDCDTGSQIKRSDFYQFCDVVVYQLRKLKNNVVIKIKSAKGIDRNKKLQTEIVKALQDAVKTNKDTLDASSYEIELRYPDSLAGVSSDQEALAVISEYWNENAHIALESLPGSGIIITAQSEKESVILKRIYEELKEASKQLSSSRPSMICCFIDGIEENQWESLKDESGLNYMTQKFFSGSNRSHVNLIAYSSNSNQRRENNIITSLSRNLSFSNRSFKYPLPVNFFEMRG